MILRPQGDADLVRIDGRPERDIDDGHGDPDGLELRALRHLILFGEEAVRPQARDESEADGKADDPEDPFPVHLRVPLQNSFRMDVEVVSVMPFPLKMPNIWRSPAALTGKLYETVTLQVP